LRYLPGRRAPVRGPAGAGRPGGSPRPRTERRPGRLSARVAAVAAALGGALLFAFATQWGSHARAVRPFIEEADRLAEAAGFGLDQVHLSGNSMTFGGDIFAALGLDAARSLLRFDGAAARARIERLPWIATASISRMFPDTVSVVVTERAPFAVWRRAAGDFLIDASGRVLAPCSPGTRPDLPRVAGEGAAPRAAPILAEIAKYPELAGRMAAAVLVAERRWSIELADGPVINLPAGGEAEALAALMARAVGEGLLEAKYAVVDVRYAGRLLLRPRQGAPANRSLAGSPQPAG
jgi:cell division protein FtsQ